MVLYQTKKKEELKNCNELMIPIQFSQYGKKLLFLELPILADILEVNI